MWINEKKDTEVFEWIEKEKERQEQSIELIASENFVSVEVMHCLLYTSDACRRIRRCRSRWSPYH